jgi:hypothetical protein
VVQLNDATKDILVTIYGAVLAVFIQELVDYLKKKTSKRHGKHFRRS